MKVQAMMAAAAGINLERGEIELGPLGDEQVEIAVESCGICHSDLSMLLNEWGMTRYPLVAGHEVVGTVAALGPHAKGLRIGQRVGLGWYSGSDMTCRRCMSGDHHLCPNAEATIVNRHGGFATRVRAHWAWTVPIPDGVDPRRAGPLFCGGVTVFNPVVQFGIRPTDRVGIVGIGGLGHLAVQLLVKWGCHVTAFTSGPAKFDEARALGAHHAVSSRDEAALASLKGTLDFILVTANATLNWPAFIDALAPRGRLHVVGAVLEPIPVAAFGLIPGQKSISGSPVGSPAVIATMLDFCARHGVNTVAEFFPMSRINEALRHLESGKARYRVVLMNDLG